MEGGSSAQPAYVFSEKELAMYRNCPELLFVGGHTSGFVNCSYCANVFRTYRRLQNELTPQQPQEAEEAKEEEEEKEEEGAAKAKSLDENGECTKLMCMKAGWCMCE